MGNFRLIKSGLDLRVLHAEIEVDGDWDPRRGQLVPEHRDTQSIHLTRAIPVAGALYRDIRVHALTDDWRRLPSIASWLEKCCCELGGSLVQAMIARLNPGARIYPHIDSGQFYRGRDRYHLVISSPAGCWFRSGEEAVIMSEGELWWFNNALQHEVINLSPDRPRLHLIFDVSRGREDAAR
jgi:hypothetical protein